MAWYNPSEPRQRNLLVIAILLLALLYPFYSFWYKGKRAEVDALQEHLENLTAANRAAQITSARGGAKDLEERMALYERQVARLEELIPAGEDVPRLLQDITADALRSDVKQARMNPEPSEPGAFYTKSSFDVAFIGEYGNIGRFLASIASLPRIVSPVDMDVRLFDRPNLYPDFKSPVVASFHIETYVLPEPGATVPDSTHTAGGSQ
jgi:type IV pilus assembly protein PilO